MSIKKLTIVLLLRTTVKLELWQQLSPNHGNEEKTSRILNIKDFISIIRKANNSICHENDICRYLYHRPKPTISIATSTDPMWNTYYIFLNFTKIYIILFYDKLSYFKINCWKDELFSEAWKQRKCSENAQLLINACISI